MRFWVSMYPSHSGDVWSFKSDDPYPPDFAAFDFMENHRIGSRLAKPVWINNDLQAMVALDYLLERGWELDEGRTDARFLALYHNAMGGDSMSDKLSVPLTADEVQALAVGDVVSVKWSGGNGPWEYVVCEKHEGVVYVATRWEMANVHPSHWMDRQLTFVGAGRPYTIVRRVTA